MPRTALVASTLLSCSGFVCAQWSQPQLLANVNTGSSELSHALTWDGLTLYITSYQTLLGEIYRATRTTTYGAFGTPVHLPELSSAQEDWSPTVRIDNCEIIFSSQRPGGGGGGPYDLWRADRLVPVGPFNAPVPITELNSTSNEYSPSLSADGLTIYFTSSRPGGQGSVDIWVAKRPSWTSPFGTATPVVEINSTTTDRDPSISGDGLVIYFTSTRGGNDDLWVASRTSPSLPFGTPVSIPALNTTASERNPGISFAGDEIIFASTRPGGVGSTDLYSSRFTGILGRGVAGPSSSQILLFSDPTSPTFVYVAASSLGSAPGITLGSRVLPLNPDPLMNLTVGGLPPYMTGYAGILNNDGLASGAMTFTGFPQLVGLRLFTAFVVLDAAAPFGMRTISNALETLVQ